MTSSSSTREEQEQYRRRRVKSIVVQFESFTQDFLESLPSDVKETCMNKFHESFNHDHDDHDYECRTKSIHTLGTVDETISTTSHRLSSRLDDDEDSMSSENGDIFTMLTDTNNVKKKTKKNQRSISFMDDDELHEIYEIESFKETEHAPEMYYSKEELEDIKAENETISFLMDNPALLKYQIKDGQEESSIVTRGLEHTSEDGAWERYERIRDATNAVIVTQGQLDMEQSMSLLKRNKHRQKNANVSYVSYKEHWWNLISEEYKKESEKAMEIAYQRGLADYQETMELQRRSIKVALGNVFGKVQEEMKNLDNDSDSDSDSDDDDNDAKKQKNERDLMRISMTYNQKGSLFKRKMSQVIMINRLSNIFK